MNIGSTSTKKHVNTITLKCSCSHNITCLDLIIELNKNKDHYLTLFDNQRRLDHIKHALIPADIIPTLED
jgi:hypothetical protein